MRRSSRTRVAFPLAVAAFLGSCDSGSSLPEVDLTRPVRFDVEAPPERYLAAYNLFAWDPSTGFSFNGRVVPYELNSALFTDYALKQRAVYIPEGVAAAYQPNEILDLPVGTVLVKNFYFPADLRAPTANLRLVETRLLVHASDGWRAFPYVWDAAQENAEYTPGGGMEVISFIAANGTTETAQYLIPQRNQCQACHERPDNLGNRAITPIGPKARHLHRDRDYGPGTGVVDQLRHLEALGMLTGLPVDDATVPRAYDFAPVEASGVASVLPADLDRAARDYLDINCAHCHAPNAQAGMTSQLFLNHDNTDLFRLGYCKRPGSAGSGTGGFEFDIVPGSPDVSILYYRMHTEMPGAMMPLLGRSLEHQAGAALIYAWIAAMAPQTCN